MRGVPRTWCPMCGALPNKPCRGGGKILNLPHRQRPREPHGLLEVRVDSRWFPLTAPDMVIKAVGREADGRWRFRVIRSRRGILGADLNAVVLSEETVLREYWPVGRRVS